MLSFSDCHVLGQTVLNTVLLMGPSFSLLFSNPLCLLTPWLLQAPAQPATTIAAVAVAVLVGIS